MKWRKIGKIFDPTTVKEFRHYIGFAQSPQTLCFDDFVRVYFSIRKQDVPGKFISHIEFIDFDIETLRIINTSKQEVIKMGELGTFDEHGIFPINPLRVGDRIFAYTCGWSRRKSVSVETGIGFSYSNDNGLTFKRNGDGPIMSISLNEPFLVGDAFVKHIDGIYHMWYIHGTNWKTFDGESEPDRVYKISHALSDDGINFKRDGKTIIADKLNSDECQALPTVEFFNDRYHMFFCFREAAGFRKIKGRGYQIGYAYSNDLNNWIRNDGEIEWTGVSDGWDSEMMCYPHIFSYKKNLYLLYNGNSFGKNGFGLAVLDSI